LDPKTYRRRLAVVGLILLPFLLLIVGFHVRDALRHGESLWPVAIGVGIAALAIGGTISFVTRDGPANTAARAARLTRWTGPIAAAIAILVALIAWIAGPR
jgi:hypothetical protein